MFKNIFSHRLRDQILIIIATTLDIYRLGGLLHFYVISWVGYHTEKNLLYYLYHEDDGTR
jgi:hypothetical protein